MRVRSLGLLSLAVVALSANALAQTAGALDVGAGAQPVGVDAQADVGRRTELAESILARGEAASGRAFDPWFRAVTRQKLMALSVASLEAQMSAPGFGTNTLGASSVDLTYTPIAPCRIIDTRAAGGAITAGATRDFLVTGTNLSSQGGSATGCGVPFGPATAVVVNFVAAGPAGRGNLEVTPFGTPFALSSIINYTAGVNIANGLVVAICNPSSTTCSNDFTIKANVSTTDLVADVQGYFRAAVQLAPVKVVHNSDVALAAACTNHSEVTINVPAAGTVVVRGDAVFHLTHTTGTRDEAVAFIGMTPTECSISHGGNMFVDLDAAAPTGSFYYFPVSLSAVFTVAAPGPRAFFLNGTGNSGTTSMFTGTLEATYYPN